MQSSSFPGVVDPLMGLPRMKSRGRKARKIRRMADGGPTSPATQPMIIEGERDFIPNSGLAEDAGYLPEHLFFSPFRFSSAPLPSNNPTNPGGSGGGNNPNPLAGLPIFTGDGGPGTDSGGGPGTPGGMGDPEAQATVAEAAAQAAAATPGSIAAGVNATLGVVGQNIADTIANIANQIGLTATPVSSGSGGPGSTEGVSESHDPGPAPSAAEASEAEAPGPGEGQGSPDTGPGAAESSGGVGAAGPSSGTGSAGDTSGGDGDYRRGGRVGRYARGGQVDWVRELVLGPSPRHYSRGGLTRQGHRVDLDGNAIHMARGGRTRRYNDGGGVFDPRLAGYRPEHNFFPNQGQPQTVGPVPQVNLPTTTQPPPRVPMGGFPNKQAKLAHAQAYSQWRGDSPKSPQNWPQNPQPQDMDFETVNMLAALPDLLTNRMESLAQAQRSARGGRMRRY